MLTENNEIEHAREYVPLEEEYPKGFARVFLSYISLHTGETFTLDGLVVGYEEAAEHEGWPRLTDRDRYVDVLMVLEFDNAVSIDWDRRVVSIAGFVRESL